MDIRKVKKLIELLEQSGIAEIEIKEGEEAVKISRYGSQAVMQTAPTPPAPIVVTKNTELPHVNEPEPVPATLGQTITSPMVGTFYIAPSPNSSPFITIGQKIKEGDVICIIEAMKIMNKIQADQSGTIVDILVKDGDGVEFGQTLVIIE